MPQLDFLTYTSQLFWFFVCWGILYIYLSKFLVPKMSAKLNAREEKIKHILAEAEQYRLQSDALQLKYDQTIKAFKQHQAEKLHDVATFIEQSKHELEADLKRDIDSKILQLETELKKSQAAILKKLPAKIESVLTAKADSYLPFDPDENIKMSKLIEDEIKSLQHDH